MLDHTEMHIVLTYRLTTALYLTLAAAAGVAAAISGRAAKGNGPFPMPGIPSSNR